MSGFVIANIDVKDSEAYKEYVGKVVPTVKKFGGEYVLAGNIIIRQRGTKYHPGDNVGMGKDHTIFSLVEGKVKFSKKNAGKTFVDVESTP